LDLMAGFIGTPFLGTIALKPFGLPLEVDLGRERLDEDVLVDDRNGKRARFGHDADVEEETEEEEDGLLQLVATDFVGRLLNFGGLNLRFFVG